MPFPPTRKDLPGLLRDIVERLGLVERRLAIGAGQSTGATVTTGTVAPATTPAKIGDIYVNTAAGKVYIATGTSSVAKWALLN